MPEELQQTPDTFQRETIPVLPFTYVRTYDSEKAAFQKWRVNPVQIVGVRPNKPLTDDEIVESVKRDKEFQAWYTFESFRKKGLPAEQIEFTVDGRQITVYNYNKDKPFTDEHIERAQRVFQEFTARFPKIMDHLRWILIDDQQLRSAFGDPENYPTNGEAHSYWQAFQLYPRGMELIPHRIKAATNFDGTLTHELTHLIQGDFEGEWREKFAWAYCIEDEYRDDWEMRPLPESDLYGHKEGLFNKKTGERSPQGQFPL